MRSAARFGYLFALLFQSVFLFAEQPAAPSSLADLGNIDAFQEAIYNRLNNPDEGRFSISNDKFESAYLLKAFYSSRDYKPAWVEEGAVKPEVNDLLNAVKQADREGLRPSDYHVSSIGSLMDILKPGMGGVEATAQFDLLLTDAFLTYGSDLVSGLTNPYDVDDDWFAGRRTGDLSKVLEHAIESREIRQTLQSLLPAHAVYQRLRDALARYRQIEKNGGWDPVPSGPSIKKGDQDPRVPLLRQRLVIESDLNQKPNDKNIFDPALEHGLKHFQARAGLYPDGVLGKSTVEALNVPVKNRIEQIRINMERCRWLPDDLGVRHIFVNVPSFTLQVMENGEETLRMRVVVGKKIRQTPVFSSTMTHIIFNPPWSVPVKLAKSDILDHIREEPNYLVTHNFEVFEAGAQGEKAIDPTSINWSSVTAQTMHYRFRQKAGPLNALGRIKFLLPNRFDVYLHDTPSRSLFSKTVRDFSSGCIRIEKPVELAHYVLADDERWSREKINEAINKGVEKAVSLPDPIPVHLMYWTAWVDEGNTVQFRDDIYGRDAMLIKAMNRGPSL